MSVVPGATKLHQAFHDAIEAGDVDAFNALVLEHHPAIVEEFAHWTTVPAAVRDDERLTRQYVESVIRIAQAFEAVGEPALANQLRGPDDSNPLQVWHGRLAHAQALAADGDVTASSAEAHAVLAEMTGASGPAANVLRAKILGLLGTNAHAAGDLDEAVRFTRLAHEACRDIGDPEGETVYRENLQALEAIRTIYGGGPVGHRLAEARRMVVAAQRESDAGRHVACIALLDEVEQVLDDHRDDEQLAALRSKIVGLRAYSAWRKGDLAKARSATTEALRLCIEHVDPHGVRIHGANLAELDAAAGGS